MNPVLLISTFSEKQVLESLLAHRSLSISEMQKYVDVRNVSQIVKKLINKCNFSGIINEEKRINKNGHLYFEYSIFPYAVDDVINLLKSCESQFKEKEKRKLEKHKKETMIFGKIAKKENVKILEYDLLELFDADDNKYIGWLENKYWRARKPNSSKTILLPFESIVRWKHICMEGRASRS